MKNREPHTISAEDVQAFLNGERWEVLASSTTADDCRRKNLEAAVGRALFRAWSRSCNPRDEPGHRTAYEGPSLEEAVAAYNGLK